MSRTISRMAIFLAYLLRSILFVKGVLAFSDQTVARERQVGLSLQLRKSSFSNSFTCTNKLCRFSLLDIGHRQKVKKDK